MQGAAAGSVAAAAAFTGAGLVFAVSGGGATIDAATGVVSLPTAALVAAAVVTVTATNSGGAASVSFRLTVRALVIAPAAVGSIPDVVLPLDNATSTVSTQAGFTGTDLIYSLLAAPAGVTIMAGSGLVSIAATAALAAARVTVQARNSAGAATQSFAVTVRAVASVFDAAARLDDLAFLYQDAAPSWTQRSRARAAGARRHRAGPRPVEPRRRRRPLPRQVRWNATDTSKAGASPFLFGARIVKSGTNFTGLYVEAARISGTERQLRLLQYTGAGTATALRGSVVSAWVWFTWYWFEMEVVGTSVKARFYAEDATEVPAWQLVATTTTAATAAGAFGPGALPLGTPVVDIKRLEFVPAAAAVVPAAAADGDWELTQIPEGK